MSQNLLKPVCRSKPIGSVAVLARSLGMSTEQLLSLSARASDLYRLAKPILKADGGIRQPYDAKPELKRVLTRLKRDLFEKVEYPKYLTGSIKGRDYKANASLHSGKAMLICEDIKKFFPSVKAAYIFQVYLRFFDMHPEVATILTRLTTKNGVLPEGAATSSYLANLVMFEWEPKLQADLAARGVTYSRYVDDIVMSMERVFSPQEQWACTRRVYAMLPKIGLQPKRSKHEVFHASEPMLVTKLVVNRKPSLTKKQRQTIRADVHRAVRRAAEEPSAEVAGLLGKVAGKVGLLSRFHPTEAARLKTTLEAARAGLTVRLTSDADAAPTTESLPDPGSPT